TELQDFVNAGDDLLWSDVREAMGGNEEIGPSTRSKRERYTDYDDETNVGVGLEEQVNALDDVDSDAEPESLICDNNKLILLASLSDSLEYIPKSIERRDKVKQDSYKKPNYVQISVDSYSHLMGLEDQDQRLMVQIKNLEDEVKDLNEQLSAAHDEITTKENVVKQHAKVT
ncbi:hypothetical protein Tco_1087375, partial [Tanacetum coccineum]